MNDYDCESSADDSLRARVRNLVISFRGWLAQLRCEHQSSILSRQVIHSGKDYDTVKINYVEACAGCGKELARWTE